MARSRVSRQRAVPKYGRLFSYDTRGYLRRRVWRYFRWMGFGRPGDYPSAIARAPMMYRDEDFDRGEHILDNWSLMNIAFRGSNQLEFTPARINIADGGSLSQLTAAPRFEDLWKKPESSAELLKLVMQANSRLIRVWAITLLKRHHASNMQQIPVEQLLQLLDHNDEDVQQFGSSLISSLTGIDSWPVSTWLRLLETRNITALATICDAMNQRVRPDRLNLEQCVALACSRVTPVARLGLSWLRNRSISSDQDRATLANLAAARCEAAAAEIAEFALSILVRRKSIRRTRLSVSSTASIPKSAAGLGMAHAPVTRLHRPGFVDPPIRNSVRRCAPSPGRRIAQAHARRNHITRDSQSGLQLGASSRQIRLKSCGPTFYGTDFVCQKTCFKNRSNSGTSHSRMSLRHGRRPRARIASIVCRASAKKSCRARELSQKSRRPRQL